MRALVIGCWLLAVGCSGAFAQSAELLKGDISENRDKTFTLYKKDTLNTSGIPVLKYAVVRNGDKRVVMEGSITMGVIEWTADYELTESKSLGSGTSSENQRSRTIDLRPFLGRKQ